MDLLEIMIQLKDINLKIDDLNKNLYRELHTNKDDADKRRELYKNVQDKGVSDG